MVIILLAPISNSAYATDQTQDTHHIVLNQADDITTGSINGISYSYGYKSVDQSYQVALSGSRTYNDNKESSRNIEKTINLITGSSIIDLYWYRYYNKTSVNPSSEWIFENGLKTNGTGLFGVWYRYNLVENGLTGGMFLQGMFVKGSFPVIYADSIDLVVLNTHVTDILDLFGNKLMEIVVPEYYIRYYVSSSNTTVFEEKLVPVRGLGFQQVEPVDVVIDEQTKVGGVLTTTFNFDDSYTLTRNGHFVQISQPNYIFNYFSLEQATLHYVTDNKLTVSGNVYANVTRNITFKANNTAVPTDMIPFGWRSNYIVAQGEWSAETQDSGDLVSASALQGIVQAMLAVKNLNEYEWSSWGVYRPNRMIGYSDLDGNNMLSLVLNGTNLQTSDGIKALGIPEGSNLAGTVDTTSTFNFRSYWQRGNDILIDANVDQSGDKSVNYDFTFGFDPTSTNYDVSLDWTNPTSGSNGDTDFSWKVDYTNIPTTWWVANGSSNVVMTEPMDFSYSYDLSLHQTDGSATLSSTYYQSAIENPQLKGLLDGLSLATYERDAFLTLSTIDSQETSGSVANSATSTDFNIGSEPTFSVGFTGAKQNYQLGSSETAYQAIASSLFAFTAEGSDGATNESISSPFISPLGQRIVAGLTKATTDEVQSNLSWKYVEAFVITSYPTWNGESITHDPTYTAHFEPTEISSSGTKKGIISPLLVVIPLMILVLNQVKNRKYKLQNY